MSARPSTWRSGPEKNTGTGSDPFDRRFEVTLWSSGRAEPESFAVRSLSCRHCRGRSLPGGDGTRRIGDPVAPRARIKGWERQPCDHSSQGDVRRLDTGSAVDPDPALTGSHGLELLPQLTDRQQESVLVGEFERWQRAGPGNVPRHGIDGFANAPEAVPGAGVQEHPGRDQPSRPISIQHRGRGVVSQPEIPRCRSDVPLLQRKTGGQPGSQATVEDECTIVPMVLQKLPRPGSSHGSPVVVDHDRLVVADPCGPHCCFEDLRVGERMPSARANARGSQRRVHVHQNSPGDVSLEVVLLATRASRSSEPHVEKGDVSLLAQGGQLRNSDQWVLHGPTVSQPRPRLTGTGLHRVSPAREDPPCSWETARSGPGHCRRPRPAPRRRSRCRRTPRRRPARPGHRSGRARRRPPPRFPPGR